MRALIALAALASGCLTPFQVAPGVAFGRSGARPLLEASGGFQGVLVADHKTHEALWLGSTLAFEGDVHAQRYFLGPELQLSRVRNPRSERPDITVVGLRPEVGWETTPLGTANPVFSGGSLVLIQAIRRIPFTLSARGGTFDSGPNRGFYGSIGVGVVVGSPLYWME
jgi:hypothetical protein